MEYLFELLSLSFVQRGLIAGLLTALLCALVGMLTVLRGSALYGDALAHASLAGVASALLLGLNPLLGAFIYALVVAFILTFLQNKSNLAIDNLIALVLPVSMGLAVILLSFFSGYQPELISYLFGSLLSVSWTDIGILSLVTIVVLGIFAWYKEKLLFVFFDPEYAFISKIKVNRINLIYNLLLALTVVTAIQTVGVILVNALLVIPTTIVRLFAPSIKAMLIFTPIVALVITLTGILFSFVFDLPTGPTIAVISGVIFVCSLVLKKFVPSL